MIDRQRASRLLEQYDLDALVLCEPEASRYATGVTAGPASLFRRAGSTFVIIPRSADYPIGLVVTDFDARRYKTDQPEMIMRTHPAWIETVRLENLSISEPLTARIDTAIRAINRPTDFARPATFDTKLAVNALKTILSDFGLRRGRLSFDLDFVPASDRDQIAGFLPDFTIINGSSILDQLRAIKNADEIRRLQQGIEFSEKGFKRLSTEGRIGMSQIELIELFQSGVKDAAANQNQAASTAEYTSLGIQPKPIDAPSESGDPLKADMICDVDGYQADMSRNFVFGTPSADQVNLHQIAEQAFEAGLERLMPGNNLSDVYHTVSHELGQCGLGSYRRGHFGHGVGLSVFSEQWPFIAADSEVEIEVGMVLAYEIPLYVEGVASFNLEDQFLITADGPVSMNRLPRKLCKIG